MQTKLTTSFCGNLPWNKRLLNTNLGRVTNQVADFDHFGAKPKRRFQQRTDSTLIFTGGHPRVNTVSFLNIHGLHPQSQ